jgi:geranylgeranyl diphosphate synthase, type II
MNLEAFFRDKGRIVDKALRQACQPFVSAPPMLRRAMEHSLFSPGKRIRPILAMAACEAAGSDSARVLPFAAAIEMIHTYSLIHDDLPSLDNDDFRRGRSTCHRKFGEACAVLAGDSLLTEAFRVMADPASTDNMDPGLVCRIVFEVASAAGANGMVGGQAMDVRFEGRKGNKSILSYIHIHKTAALIRASVRVGALTAGAEPKVLAMLTTYGEKVGLAFQIVDDLLDATGDEKKVGKKLHKDVNKQTYIKHYGVEPSRKRVEALIAEALQSLKSLGARAEPLSEIARFVGSRVF